MMLWVSLPVKDNHFLVYLSGVIAATILEYITGYVMERLFKVKYWDYSNQRFNLDGYICLSSSIAWGFLTILMTEVIHRPIEHLVLGLHPVTESLLLTIISFLFTADVIQSTKEALDLAHALEAVTRLRGELDEMQVQLALLKAETEQNIQKFRDMHSPVTSMETLFKKSRAHALRKAKEGRMLILRNAPGLSSHMLKISSYKHMEQLAARLSEESARLRQFLDARYLRILKRNPSASSRYFAAALKELKEAFSNMDSTKN